MFNFSKVFVALVAATAVVAAPNKRQSFDDVTCTFVLSSNPTITPGSITASDLNTEFNFVIGRSLAVQVSGTTVDGFNDSVNENADYTFTVVRTAGVDGKTAAQTATILTGLVGTTAGGFLNNAEFNWTFDSVYCDA